MSEGGGYFGAPEPGQLRRRGLYGRFGVSSRLRRAGGARWAGVGCVRGHLAAKKSHIVTWFGGKRDLEMS